MTALRLYAARTCGALLGSASAAVGAVLFLAVSSFLFARALTVAEGRVAAAAVLWTTAAEWTLPALAALVTMRTIAGDRASGRLELILTTPRPDREYVLGRFAGALIYVALVLAVYAAVPLVVLPCFGTVSGLGVFALAPAMFGLLLQAALWCAVGVWASARCRAGAVAGALTYFLCALLPQALYAGACAWRPLVRARLPVYPGVAQLADAASGVFRFSSVAIALLFTAAALYLAVGAVASARWVGRGARAQRRAGRVVAAACCLFTLLAAATARQLDFWVVWPLPAPARRFAPRTCSILADIATEVRVTCFLPRAHAAWKSVHYLLEGFKAQVATSGGRLVVDYVDPRWDLAAAARLVRDGVQEGSVVFSGARGRIVLPAAEVEESACASAVQRLALPAARETVYWTTGHGECAFDSYDSLSGMSTLARALRRDGYVLKPLDTAAALTVPDDCGVLVIASPRTAFSASETAVLEAFLRREGRLLAFLSPGTGTRGGLGRLLAAWGVVPLPYTVLSPRTRDGVDLVARDWGDHPIVQPLTETAVLFQNAVPLAATAAATGGVEKTRFTPLVCSDGESWGESEMATPPWTYDPETEPRGPFNLAVAVEHGDAHGQDLALKPTRLVVVGDAAFAVDGALAARANANADFVRNALAWLAGLDAMTAPGTPANVLNTGMDRTARIRFTLWAALVVPWVLALPYGVAALRRRMRS